MLSTEGRQPKFVVLYTIEHNSSEAVPIYKVNADLFINEQAVANYSKSYNQELIAPNHPVQYRLEIPTNPTGKASIDSLRNNSLLMMQGSCVLKVTVTDRPELQNLNPSTSYQGIISIDSPEQNQAREQQLAQERAQALAREQEQAQKQAQAQAQAAAAAAQAQALEQDFEQDQEQDLEQGPELEQVFKPDLETNETEDLTL